MRADKPFITDENQLKMMSENAKGKMEYTLMNDFLAKYSFQNDLYALKGLLAALLHIKVDEITDIIVCNPIELKDSIDTKECILDIKIELNNSRYVNVEIQSVKQDFWPERSLTYLCRNFDQLKSGEIYSKIKPCVHIGIMAKDIFSKDDPRYTGDFYSEYRLLHSNKHTEYSGKFEIRVLSLSQLENASDEDKADPNGLYRWAKLFAATSWDEFIRVVKDESNPMMSSLMGTVMMVSAEEKVKQACEAREKYLCDIATYEYEISERNGRIAELDAVIAEKEASIAEKDKLILELRRQLEKKDK